jgi:hypothetical protein
MRTAVMAAAVAATAGGAHAQQCATFAQRSSFAELNIARVKPGATRVPFMTIDCTPRQPGDCHAMAFVVPGDVVLVGHVFDTSTCAAYVNVKGQVSAGLLPNAQLEAPTPRSKAVATEFIGVWTRMEAEIVVTPNDGTGLLSFSGQATSGAFGRGRIARGDVNHGEISFDLKPASNRLAVALTANAQGATEAVAPEKGDPTDCVVAMIALGPYLVVEDNRNCGGHTVTFTGIYRKGR